MSFSHRAYLKIGSHDGTDLDSLVKGGGYELQSCNFSLQQGTDHKGKASTAVHGGTLHLTLTQLPGEDIIQWGIKSSQYNKGAIILFDEHDQALERILFENAACVSFSMDYTLSGNSYVTTHMVIHAEKLVMGNGVDFTNNWIH